MNRIILASTFLLLGLLMNTSCKKDEIRGCTDPASTNYNPQATQDDGSCVIIVKGCTNPKATNYNPAANQDDGSCIIKGCTNPLALNYDPEATVDDGSCLIKGCTDPAAINYNPEANVVADTCKYYSTLFLGLFEGKLACTNALISQYTANQVFGFEMKEVPNDHGKVSVTLTIGGTASPTPAEALINGRVMTFTSTQNQQGVTINMSGELTLSNDNSKLTGPVSISVSILGQVIADNCTLEAFRK